MINDVLTGRKGPVAMGMLLGLTVLVGFSGLAYLVFEDDFSGKDINTRIKENERHIAFLQDRQMRAKERIEKEKEITERNAQLQRKQKSIEDAEGMVDDLNKKILRIKREFIDYIVKYRLEERARAIGEEIDTLKLKNGKQYKRVKIKGVNALRMHFSYLNENIGFTSNTHQDYTELPGQFQDRFQFELSDGLQQLLEFNDDGAEKQRNREQVLRANLKRGQAGFQLQNKINFLKMKVRDATVKQHQLETAIIASRAKITKNEREILRKEGEAQNWRGKENRGFNWDKAKKLEAAVLKAKIFNNKLKGAIRREEYNIEEIKRGIRAWQQEIDACEGEKAKLNKEQAK